MPTKPPLKTRLLILGISSLVTAGLAEGMVRVADGNALPMIRLFETNAEGHIGLQANGSARISSPVGKPWEIHTDAHGRRIPPRPLSDKAWVVVGDSQVMGNSVSDAEPFPALLNLGGEPAHNLGVPGYGVSDALWSAKQHLDRYPAAGVIVIVNQMNDWEETEAPVGSRYTVRGGWLLDAEDAHGARGSFLASPLSRPHLGFLLGHLILKDWEPPSDPIPAWMSHPTAQREITLRIANAIKSFSDGHPNTPVVPVYLPADIYASEGRSDASPLTQHLSDIDFKPWEDDRLRNQVMTALSDFETIDLTPNLSDKSAFLERDYHLSSIGHQAVANTIMSSLEKPTPPAEVSATKEESPAP